MDSGFQLSSYKWLGFDLDHTIVRYHIAELETLVYQAFVKYLVTYKNYPQQLLSTILQPATCFRGLLVDLETGHILKIDCDNMVVRAYHGKKQLTEEQLRSTYPKSIEFDGVHTAQFWSVSTFFESAAAPLWMEMVELIDTTQGVQSSYHKLLKDPDAAVNFNFRTFPEGFFFPQIIKSPETYLFKRDEVVDWLKRIRKGSDSISPIHLFLLTNSDASYAKFLCDYCLGDGWEDLFDIILYFGRKPSFWSSSQPSTFECIEFHGSGFDFTIDKKIKSIDLNKGKHYRLGNGAELHVSINNIINILLCII